MLIMRLETPLTTNKIKLMNKSYLHNVPKTGFIGGYMQCRSSMKSSIFFRGSSISLISFSLKSRVNMDLKTGDHAARTYNKIK